MTRTFKTLLDRLIHRKALMLKRTLRIMMLVLILILVKKVMAKKRGRKSIRAKRARKSLRTQMKRMTMIIDAPVCRNDV